MVKNMIKEKLKDLTFTEDGYIVKGDYYIGLKGDEFEWYGDYELCKENLEPFINVNVLDNILDFLKQL